MVSNTGHIPAKETKMKTLRNLILAAAAAVALVSAVTGYTGRPELKPVAVFDDPVPQPNCPDFPEPCQ